MTELDMQQLLPFEEGMLRHAPMVGKADARSRAAEEMPLAFGLPVLEAAARGGDPLLPSYLGQVLGWVSQRDDWLHLRQGFVGAARDAHLAEAARRTR